MGTGRRVWEAVGGALVFGVLAGLALGASAVLYAIAVVIAIGGGVLAGTQHDRAAHAAARGVAGGLSFGAGVLLGFHLGGAGDAAVALPEPEALYLVLATVPSPFLHLLGWRFAGPGRKADRSAS